MIRIQAVQGIRKKIFNTALRIRVFLYFLFRMLRGKLSLKLFSKVIRRLNYFLSHVQHNKFVKIGKQVKIDLYVPGYPSLPFFRTCGKVCISEGTFPCLTALISITSACRFKCRHCYQKHDRGKDIDIDTLVNAVQLLQDKGVTFFNIEGGEPFLAYDRLKKVCEATDDRSEIWVNSTGDSMTDVRLRELKGLGLTAVMFSLHSHDPDEFNSFLGSDRAWDTLSAGIRLCHENDIPVTFNCCLTRDKFYDGTFEKVMDKAYEFNGALIQLIKPKPAGGWLETGIEKFSSDDLNRAKELAAHYNSSPACTKYPAISAQIIEEDRRVFGCTAGGTDRFYINAKGDVQPCEFLNISFGNIGDEPFEDIYSRMRREFNPPCSDWLCEKYSKEVAELKTEHNLYSLPLSPELSKEIYADWDRGEPTELYKRLYEM